MAEYKDIPLKQMVDLAKNSSSELGAVGGRRIVDYENGRTFEASDEETALFIASARSIVLELARRIQAIENPHSHLSMVQWEILEAAQLEWGTSVGMFEETKFRQACDLVDEGLLKKVRDQFNGSQYHFHISINGRRALKFRPVTTT